MKLFLLSMTGFGTDHRHVGVIEAEDLEHAIAVTGFKVVVNTFRTMAILQPDYNKSGYDLVEIPKISSPADIR